MNRLSKNNFEYYKNKTLKMQEDGIPSNFDALCTWQFYDLKEFMFYLGFTLRSTPKQKFYWHKYGGLFESTQYISLETAVRLYNGGFYSAPFQFIDNEDVKDYLVCYHKNQHDTKKLIVYANDLTNAFNLRAYSNIDLKFKFDKKDNLWLLTTSKTKDNLLFNEVLEKAEYTE